MRGLYLKENTPHPSSLREDTLSRKGRGFSDRSGALLRARSAHHDSLIQFLIDNVDRVVDLGIGHAELMRDQPYQEVDPLDEGRAAGHRTRRRRRLEKALRRLGIFLKGNLVVRIGPQSPRNGVDMLINRLREF